MRVSASLHTSVEEVYNCQMEKPARFDPSAPVFLAAPAAPCVTLASKSSVKDVPEAPVNPLVAFLTNETMRRNESDDEAPSASALPVPW